MSRIASSIGFGLALLLGGCAGEEGTETVSTPMQADESMLAFTMNRLDGTPQDLRAFQGNVVLIVNTASECGLTPQYEGLEALYQRRKGDGLVVLGFPSNDFGRQEPGTNDEIMAFCRSEYGVTFPMFEKVSVRGDETHPFYGRLTEASEAPDWNFTKYLLDREGRLVRRFGPATRPDDPELAAEIDRLLETG